MNGAPICRGIAISGPPALHVALGVIGEGLRPCGVEDARTVARLSRSPTYFSKSGRNEWGTHLTRSRDQWATRPEVVVIGLGVARFAGELLPCSSTRNPVKGFF